ncbi:uncharacterized SAM-binding protein YcdF (DUF218 family) [Nakamurella flavida]|uniref:YdcF family protein n=1 Tax=Nakamurella flavida TaxID=363630 RepID=UPI00278740B0|nr:YdcF family protein [Nakamurella flavida]MDP9776450.1 uncharacterized SAM-binding protein YcdF (DUF218 family) [Nakamurella flavida]
MTTVGRTVVRYLAGFLVVAVLVVAGTVVHIEVVAQRDQRDPAAAIVVLGAAQYDGDPSPVFAARLDHAAELYRAGVAAHVVTVGGGQQGDATTEGAAGREYLLAAGLPADAVVAVGSGEDTLLSLRDAAPTLRDRGWTSVVLVTDPWHAARAALMAGDLGMDVQVSSVQQGPSLADGVQARYVLRETLGVLFYRLTGGSSGVGSAVL